MLSRVSVTVNGIVVVRLNAIKQLAFAPTAKVVGVQCSDVSRISALKNRGVRVLMPSEVLAVSVTVVSETTATAVATNVAEFAPIGTVTLAGTETAGLSTESIAVNPPERAAVFKETVHGAEPGPLNAAGEQRIEDSCGGGVKVNVVLCDWPANVAVMDTD